MIPYLQTTPFTCAASALLTILHHRNPKIKLTKENEFKIWKYSANLPIRASSIYALAAYAKKAGLNPKIIVEKKGYDFPDYRFYRYTKADIEQAEFSSNLHLRQAENYLEIKEKIITLKEIKNLLKNNMILLLRLNIKPIRKTKRNTSNYIVIEGYKNKQFKIVDPLVGALSIQEDIFKEAFKTLKTRKYRDHRMIIF